MTVSEGPSVTERWLDAVVCTPLGAVLLKGRDPDRWTQVGRNELRTANLIGRLVVQSRAGRVSRDKSGPRSDAPPMRPSTTPETRAASEKEHSDLEPVVPVARPRLTGDKDEAAVAIADYDVLPASDIVQMLERLSAEERSAIEKYEIEHRGRRTILHRLIELADAPPRVAAPPPAQSAKPKPANKGPNAAKRRAASSEVS